VLGEVEDGGIEGFELYADGSISEHLIYPAGGTRKPFSEEVLRERSYYTKMNGSEVFKFSVREISRISKKLLEKQIPSLRMLTGLFHIKQI